jgi:hypothetical protein
MVTDRIGLEVKRFEDGDDALLALRIEDGNFIHPDLLATVEKAIKEYPDQGAPQWLGGVSAIRIVETWLIERGLSDGPAEPPVRGGERSEEADRG